MVPVGGARPSSCRWFFVLHWEEVGHSLPLYAALEDHDVQPQVRCRHRVAIPVVDRL